MTNWRRPLLILGVALLYAGVVLGGMSLPFRAALFFGTAALLAYNCLMRPVKSWAPNIPALILSLVVLALVSAALAGFGGVLTRWITPPPELAGPVTALIGLALSRLGWSAAKEDALDSFLTEATAQISDLSREVTAAPHRPDLPELSRATAAAIDDLRAGLADLPQDAAARSAELDRLAAPLTADWSDVLVHLGADGAPDGVEAASLVLLSNEVLPQAFGHPEAERLLAAAFLSGDAALAEASARRALALDLDATECWRLLPAAEALGEAARLLDDPPALTALAAEIAEREAEDAARPD